MGIWDALGSTAGKAIADPIKAAGDGLNSLFTSDDERLAWLNKYDEIQKTLAIGQQEVNKIEAASSSLFVSGWRPFIGWVCGICVAIYYGIQAIVLNVMWIYMSCKAGHLVPFPGDPHGLIELTGGVLGIYGTLRTVEKLKGLIT